MRKLRRSWIGAATLAVCLMGCGADEEPQASGVRMVERATEPSDEAEAAGANEPPRIHAVRLRPNRPRAGEPLRAVVEASDPEGDSIRYRFEWTVNGRARNESGPEIQLAGARRGDKIAVRVVASDGHADSEPAHARTRLGNRPPQLTRVSLDPAGEIKPGIAVRAVVEGTDPDGDPLEYEYTWFVNDRKAKSTEAQFSTESLRRGDTLQVEVVAIDREGERSSVTRSANLRLGNGTPQIVSKPSGVDEGGVFRYAVQARDPDGDAPLRYRLVQAPAGMEIDPVGEILWQPTPQQVGRHPVHIVVDDGKGGKGSQRFELIIGSGEGQPASPEPE